VNPPGSKSTVDLATIVPVPRTEKRGRKRKPEGTNPITSDVALEVASTSTNPGENVSTAGDNAAPIAEKPKGLAGSSIKRSRVAKGHSDGLWRFADGNRKFRREWLEKFPWAMRVAIVPLKNLLLQALDLRLACFAHAIPFCGCTC
jgi:hypothetical protein